MSPGARLRLAERLQQRDAADRRPPGERQRALVQGDRLVVGELVNRPVSGARARTAPPARVVDRRRLQEVVGDLGQPLAGGDVVAALERLADRSVKRARGRGAGPRTASPGSGRGGTRSRRADRRAAGRRRRPHGLVEQLEQLGARLSIRPPRCRRAEALADHRRDVEHLARPRRQRRQPGGDRVAHARRAAAGRWRRSRGRRAAGRRRAG